MKRKKDHLKLVNEKKPRAGWKKLFRFFFRLAILATIVFLLGYAETFFRVVEINVEGAEKQSAAEIITAGKIKKGMSIFLLQEKKIEDLITERYPGIKNIELIRQLPDLVTLKVVERIPAGYVMTADGYWIIDRDAVCYEYAEAPQDDYPVISGIDGLSVIPGAPLGCPERSRLLKRFFSIYSSSDLLPVRQLDVTDNYNLVVYIDDSLELWLGDGSNLEQKLYLVREAIPYIELNGQTRLDVRSGNRLVVSSSSIISEEEVEP
ncbi:MAG: FtsQ-type POTRA domain-containing protein [Bacillota bacterium]|nr:FtsQ-type POTRA domain-containing protein [Bacillota bacterium]